MVTLPPPDCAVIVRIVAVLPLKITSPFAFEIPLGRATWLNDASVTRACRSPAACLAFRGRYRPERRLPTRRCHRFTFLQDTQIRFGVEVKVHLLRLYKRQRACRIDIGFGPDNVGAVDADCATVERSDNGPLIRKGHWPFVRSGSRNRLHLQTSDAQRAAQLFGSLIGPLTVTCPSVRASNAGGRPLVGPSRVWMLFQETLLKVNSAVTG